MSPNRRIFLNIIATYGRSLYALVCGLFTARWVLEALGQVDLGLYGLMGNGTTEYTKRGKAEVAKADRPQTRRGASAAANTRKDLAV